MSRRASSRPCSFHSAIGFARLMYGRNARLAPVPIAGALA